MKAALSSFYFLVEYMIIGISAIIGAIIGSFLSVVVTRYEKNEGIIRGRSHCRLCHVTIAWYDNIPLVSYCLLRGKCRSCSRRIPVFYWAIEAVTAATFVGVVVSYGAHISFVPPLLIKVIFAWAIAAGLIAIFFYDIRTMHIPMHVVWFVCLVLCGGILYALFYDADFLIVDVRSAIFGGFIGFIFLYLLSALSQERLMGAGDAYIGFIGGLIVGWPAVIFFLTISFGFGAVIGVALIILKLKTRKDAVPFAPFLILGIAGTVLFPLFFPRIASMMPYFNGIL